MAIILLGPVIGTFIFFGYFGLNAANEVILPFAIIGGVLVGLLPASFTGLLFYPTYLVTKKLITRYKKFTNGTLGLIVGAFLGALSLFMFFYVNGNISKTQLSEIQLNILLPLIFFAPGGVLGYISAKIIELINEPNK